MAVPIGTIRDQYFESLSADPSNPRWKCVLCGRRTMAYYGNHMNTPKHRQAVARFEAQQASANLPLPGLNPDPPPSPGRQTGITEDNPVRSETPEIEEEGERPPSPLTFLRALKIADDSDLGMSELDIDLPKLAEALTAMEDEDANDQMDEAELEEELKSCPVTDDVEWYPFKKKEVCCHNEIILPICVADKYLFASALGRFVAHRVNEKYTVAFAISSHPFHITDL
ncbi:uncharacterized protein MELLADRAFT_95547 [Melampsora larici-populina 98AG31]|uniref:Uncharacterized protein n=1 Tax=Melampsora larici-populina (strain 98AG31 / pathotype 3-4-7) TaxID=747676 RepID=F4S9R0_MELLP|nr:uncharacterized protein MELLADRAFT_95547 [Melampsora larici-populina 98AG31]EGF98624.1 hypothetical protein MELLADRAFT_95547 [Melampsora larici-populina 98AG31]